MAQPSKLLLPALGCCALPIGTSSFELLSLFPTSTESVLFQDSYMSTESVSLGFPFLPNPPPLDSLTIHIL